jgi:hypothetical protein
MAERAASSEGRLAAYQPHVIVARHPVRERPAEDRFRLFSARPARRR